MALWALLAAWASAEPALSVRILEKRKLSQVQIKEEGNDATWADVKLTRGVLTVNGKPENDHRWGGTMGFRLKATGLRRHYPGSLVVSTSPEAPKEALMFLNDVSMNDYVGCVTASESGFDESEPEYIKALAAVIRGYAQGNHHRHKNYDLCDLAHCQVYQGYPPHVEFWKKTIEACKDLPKNMAARPFYFHRCCGGTLESADQVWGGPRNHPLSTRTGPDELNGKILCESDSFFRWNTSTQSENIRITFGEMANLPEGSTLRSMRIVEKTTHGRNKTLEADFYSPDGRTREVRENVPRFISMFGKRYGWRVFPSDWFEIQKDGDLYRFTGHGLGHGVGLCQSGALELARMGWGWKDILNFYFPAN